jgi:transposase
MNVHLTLQSSTRRWWRRGAGHSIKGEYNQAIGRSLGGRTTKIHALTDICCRQIAFLLTGGHVAADELLDRLLAAEILHGDKGYDSNAVRQKIESKGVAPNIPPQTTRPLEKLLLAVALSSPQCDRAHVRTPEGLSSHRNPLRPTRT